MRLLAVAGGQLTLPLVADRDHLRGSRRIWRDPWTVDGQHVLVPELPKDPLVLPVHRFITGPAGLGADLDAVLVADAGLKPLAGVLAVLGWGVLGFMEVLELFFGDVAFFIDQFAAAIPAASPHVPPTGRIVGHACHVCRG